MSAAGEYDTSYAYAIGLNGDMLQQGEATKENLTSNDKSASGDERPTEGGCELSGGFTR